MVTYLVERLLRLVATVVAASVIVFLALYFLTDPVVQMLPLGSTAEEIQAFRQALGLDDPLWTQYLRFVSDALHLDFGNSLYLGEPALASVLERLPATFFLSILAMLVAVVLGVALGVSSATSKSRRYRSAINSASYIAVSLSEVWVALILVLIFGVQLGWTQTSGYGYGYQTLALPLVTLAIRPIGRMIQVVQTAMDDEALKDYATTASYKGLGQQRVHMVHMFRNCVPSIVTFAMYDLGRLFAGAAVIVEAIFGWPGIGRLAVESLNRGDLYLTQAIVVVVAICVAFLNFLADLVHLWIDPRVRSGLDEAR